MCASTSFFFFAFKAEQQYATFDKLLKITQSDKNGIFLFQKKNF